MSFSLTALAAERVCTDDTPYQFPVIPGMSEWEGFQTKQEMLDVCQIPEDKLKNMTTEALLETVMKYPLIDNYFVFNTVEDACCVMSSDFNGFEEFFSRDDVTAVLLEKYSTTNVLSASEATLAMPSEFFESSTVEYLIVCNEIKNGKMEGTDLERFNEIHNLKTIERSEAGIYSMHSEIYLTHTLKSASTKAAGDTWTDAGTVKTPNGSKVSVYKRSPDYTSTEKKK